MSNTRPVGRARSATKPASVQKPAPAQKPAPTQKQAPTQPVPTQKAAPARKATPAQKAAPAQNPAPAQSRADAGATGGVQSVDRAISVLEILARRGEARVTEVAAEISVHKSTAFRLLGALEDRGLVEQDSDRGKYRLGFGIVRLAGAVAARMDLTREARPVCERLAQDSGETVNLAVAQSHYAVNVDQVPGAFAIAAQNWVGRLTPLHATSSGKILLAHLDAARRAELLDAAGLERFTKHTISSAAKLEKQLAAACERGYATTIEEYEQGLNAIAAPVRSHRGDVVAAVSVSGPAYRLTPASMEEFAPTLVDGAREISHRLGYLG
ncbi:IclR family transcriptional regulator [Rugosimonospora africana]|nr:IclR family transcriptional regulator [Rugosimonospora africana]